MLSADKVAVSKVAESLGIDNAYGDLLPEGKVEKVQALKMKAIHASIGDGVNDAPVVALWWYCNGWFWEAMQQLKTADIVIQNDQPSKIVTAIKIGKITRSIVSEHNNRNGNKKSLY